MLRRGPLPDESQGITKLGLVTNDPTQLTKRKNVRGSRLTTASHCL